MDHGGGGCGGCRLGSATASLTVCGEVRGAVRVLPWRRREGASQVALVKALLGRRAQAVAVLIRSMNLCCWRTDRSQNNSTTYVHVCIYTYIYTHMCIHAINKHESVPGRSSKVRAARATCTGLRARIRYLCGCVLGEAWDFV